MIAVTCASNLPESWATSWVSTVSTSQNATWITWKLEIPSETLKFLKIQRFAWICFLSIAIRLPWCVHENSLHQFESPRPASQPAAAAFGTVSALFHRWVISVLRNHRGSKFPKMTAAIASGTMILLEWFFWEKLATLALYANGIKWVWYQPEGNENIKLLQKSRTFLLTFIFRIPRALLASCCYWSHAPRLQPPWMRPSNIDTQKWRW